MLQSIIDYFTGFWGMVELAGTIASLICVYLATKHNQWTWFFGAIGVILFGSLFYNFNLYSDAGLQLLFFLPMQVWGFFYWKSIADQNQKETVTLSLSQGEIGIVTFGIVVFAAINGYLMSKYTDASFAYLDALTTWMSIAAQILMIRKFWQSWVIWSTMDVIAIGVYFAKGLYVTSGLYVVFLFIAVYGSFKWYNDWKSQ